MAKKKQDKKRPTKKSVVKKAPPLQHPGDLRERDSGGNLPDYNELLLKQGKPSLADRLRLQKDIAGDTTPHVMVEARAGTGKTTTLIEGIKRVKGLESSLTPSPQQAAVWEAMEQSKGKVTSICFAAFNRSIKDELKKRVPLGCDAMTMHGMGFRAVQKAFGGNVQVNDNRVEEIICKLLNEDIWDLRRTRPVLLRATCELVNKCKVNLVGFFNDATSTNTNKEVLEWVQPCWNEALSDLASYYDIDLNGENQEIFNLVPCTLERCKDVAKDSTVDYADMVWLPVVLNLPVTQYDMLLIDEAQDLNRCQQALVKKAGKRLVLCGDPKQAIYGFAGADAECMARMERELSETDRGCIHLPLTVTRRCGKEIVREAQRYVPDFSAHETNPEGVVRQALLKSRQGLSGGATSGYQSMVQDGDMVLCRVNAPLISECFAFLQAGRKAEIQGRDIGAGLINTVKKLFKIKPGEESRLADYGVDKLIKRLDVWIYLELNKENAKRNPSETKLMALQDKYDCLACFTEGTLSALDVVGKVNLIFTDSQSGVGIKLSSIHKAKGLEAKRVFFIRTEEAPCPHPMAKIAWAREQEDHLMYVAITRGIEELVYVI